MRSYGLDSRAPASLWLSRTRAHRQWASTVMRMLRGALGSNFSTRASFYQTYINFLREAIATKHSFASALGQMDCFGFARMTLALAPPCISAASISSDLHAHCENFGIVTKRSFTIRRDDHKVFGDRHQPSRRAVEIRNITWYDSRPGFPPCPARSQLSDAHSRVDIVPRNCSLHRLFNFSANSASPHDCTTWPPSR